ncbi:MAG TPA: hypothetical protein VFE51_18820 [Verrucomicrobiae bacterium]|nr:hypothetical protein [Verrucomicrobiae bacterium]
MRVGVLEGEPAEDIRPTVLRSLAHNPELTLGVMNDGHGVPGSRADGPAATEEIDLVVRVDAPTQGEGQMEIQQRGIRTGPQHVTLLRLRLSESLIP